MTSDISMYHYSTKDDKFAPTLQLPYKNCFACVAENRALGKLPNKPSSTLNKARKMGTEAAVSGLSV